MTDLVHSGLTASIPSETLSEVRARAWVTRRGRYGARGHAGSYSRSAAERGALGLVIKLMKEGVLSEGQVCRSTRLDRVTVRAMADAAMEARREGTGVWR